MLKDGGPVGRPISDEKQKLIDQTKRGFANESAEQDQRDADLQAKIDQSEQELAKLDPGSDEHASLAYEIYKLKAGQLRQDIQTIESNLAPDEKDTTGALDQLKAELRALKANRPANSNKTAEQVGDGLDSQELALRQFGALGLGGEASEFQQRIAEQGDFPGSEILYWASQNRDGSVVSNETLARIEQRALDLTIAPEPAEYSLTLIREKIDNGERLTIEEQKVLDDVEKFQQNYKIPLAMVETGTIDDIVNRKIENTIEGAQMLLNQIDNVMNHFYIVDGGRRLTPEERKTLSEKVASWRQKIMDWITKEGGGGGGYFRDAYEPESEPISYTNSIARHDLYGDSFDTDGYVRHLVGGGSVDGDEASFGADSSFYLDDYYSDADNYTEDASEGQDWYDPDEDWLTNIRENAPSDSRYTAFGLSQQDLVDIEYWIVNKVTDRYVSSAGVHQAMVQTEWDLASGGREFMQEPREMVALGIEAMRWLYNLKSDQYRKFAEEIHRATGKAYYAFESDVIQGLCKFVTGFRLNAGERASMNPNNNPFGEDKATHAKKCYIRRRNKVAELSKVFAKHQDSDYYFKRTAIGDGYNDNMIMVDGLIAQLNQALVAATVEQKEKVGLTDGAAEAPTN
jgi:hypothetical protein